MQFLSFQPTDTLSDILKAVKKHKWEKVCLLLPFPLAGFCDVLHYRILKEEALQLDIDISLVSQHPDVVRLAQQADIALAHQSTDDSEDEQRRVASKNKQPTPPKRRQETVSAEDILQDQKEQEAHKPLRERVAFHCTQQITAGSVLFMALVGAVVSLFVFVLYIALPSAQVTITPYQKEVSTSLNLLFGSAALVTDQDLFPNFIPVEEMTVSIDRQIEVKATGQELRGTKSRGEITLYNEHNKEKYLVASRLVTDDGLQFRMLGSVTLPPRSKTGPWFVTIPVEADDYDTVGKVIGNRGNIAEGQLFRFPAIPYLSPRFYYGKNQKSFTGGNIEIIPYVIAEDIDAGKKEIESVIRSEAKNMVLQQLKQRKETAEYQILAEESLLPVNIVSFDVPKDIVGKKQNTFLLGARAQVTVRVYKKWDVETLLTNALKQKLHPDMFLRRVDTDHIVFRFLPQKEEETKDGMVRVQAEIRGVMSYDFSSQTEFGKKLQDRVYEKTIGRPEQEARSLLWNMEEIADVHIEKWPFWTETLPSLRQSIDIRMTE